MNNNSTILLNICYKNLYEINLTGQFNITQEDLAITAQIFARDLEKEPPSAIEASFNRWRRSQKKWPKIADILEYVDEFRPVDSTQKALPVGEFAYAKTPGMKLLCTKFFREHRPIDEFKEAFDHFKVLYAEHRRNNWQWPNTDEEMKLWLDQLFGKPAKQTDKSCIATIAGVDILKAVETEDAQDPPAEEQQAAVNY